MLLNGCNKYNIDIMLLNKMNIKWNVLNQDRMERKLKVLGCEVFIVIADSTLWNIMNYDWLPGGLITAVRGKAKSLTKENQVEKGCLRNWIVVKFS